jgi:4-hydroxy-tetrahydrodipicolinate synthase
MIAAHDAGDTASARQAHDESTPVIEALMGTGLGAVTAKAAMQALGVIPNRVMRLPHVALDDGEYAELRSALTAAGVRVKA